MARKCRIDIVEMVHKAGAGHPGGSLSAIDLIVGLYGTGFRFKLDSTTYPNLEYFCTQVTLPGLTLGSVDVPYRGANLSMTGDRMTFEDLNITFNTVIFI